MRKCLWLCSIIVTWFLQHNQVATADLCPNMQKLALFQFKLSLSINTSASTEYCSRWGLVLPLHPKITNWSISSDCCTWDGVTCDQITGDLIGLDLSCSQLVGVIPGNSILFQLSHLKYLNLTFNFFSGPIPRFISNLTQLTDLRLGYNHFSGLIPDTLANLQTLTVLKLSRNNLSGQFPSWLFNLPLLTNLSLDNNKFTGQLDEFSSSSSSLLYFSCSNNLLNGAIAQSFFELVNHTSVGSSLNNTSGALNVVKFPHLENLDLSYNSLSMMRITSTATLLPNLKYLRLMFCKIKEFPQFIRSLKNLIYLDMSNNQIVGEIPQWFGSMLKVNQFPFPLLNISYNCLTGGLEHLPWISLAYLDLQSNMLNGSLPASICNSSSLRVLNLSHNNLSGVLPTCPKNLDYNLRVLDLGMNSIEGNLPSTLSNFRMLESLNLFGNKLEGTIPVSFADFYILEALNLGSNKLTGTFPQWLEDLQFLQVLILKSNKFLGIINTTSNIEHPFPSLRIIDISRNEFSGPLPAKYFKNFKGMMNGEVNKLEMRYMGNDRYRDTMSIVIKGVEFEFVRILTVFTTIDLSRNKFEGEIPEYMGNLKSLRYLNLSRNHLSGQIPSLIGKLLMLESLDLSFNQLEGVIPQQLTGIYSLSHLNLSQNNLSGHIPEGAQFNTFENDSYTGNLRLCGPPMSKKCMREIIETQQEEDGDDDFFFSGFSLEAVVIGYGSGVVLGFVVGYMMFKAGKPKWFTGIIARELGLKVRRLEIRRFF